MGVGYRGDEMGLGCGLSECRSGVGVVERLQHILTARSSKCSYSAVTYLNRHLPSLWRTWKYFRQTKGHCIPGSQVLYIGHRSHLC